MTDPLSKPTMSVPDAGALLGLGRNAAYDAAKRGELPTIKIGGRIMVVTAKFREMLDARQEPPAASDDMDALVEKVAQRVMARIREALR